MKVTVEYTGKYPNACRGNLIVKRDGDIIYESYPYSFGSNGRVWFDDDWSEHVEDGNLYMCSDELARFNDWAETQPESDNIKQMVNTLIEDFDGCCCGGCV